MGLTPALLVSGFSITENMFGNAPTCISLNFVNSLGLDKCIDNWANVCFNTADKSQLSLFMTEHAIITFSI